jgi:hypothetical protein
VALSSGFFALTQTDPGSEQAFVYTPNNEIVAPLTVPTSAAGTCIIDPLDFGGDTMGETMQSDFEFAIVGVPAYTFGDGSTFAADSLADDSPEERAS